MYQYTCEMCKKIFYDYKSNYRRFCSHKCDYKNRSLVLKRKHPRYWLGKHRDKTTKEKISKNNGGFKRGKLNPSWNGGVTSREERIRASVEYGLWRNAIWARDNWTCQKCKIRGGILHAHHIKPFSKFPEIRLAIDNGTTLCVKCHRKEHKGGK